MTQPTNEEERKQKSELIKSAAEYVAGKIATGKKDGETLHPLNRGDILLLIALIDRELLAASADFADPFNAKRLTAIREKLGNFAVDAPQMSKAEAQQFRE